MRTIKQLTNTPFLNLKEVNDPNLKSKGYLFAERKGIDSVAFICFSKEKGQFLINREATPPLGVFLLRAFGGSLDKDDPYKNIVQAEVMEEAGYKVNLADIKLVGQSFVSTQMNQYCHLYVVFISDKQKVQRQPENATEALSCPVWVSGEEIIEGDDWKSIVILEKARYANIVNWENQK